MKDNVNPVEIAIKKDIYIIKNDINNKVYIGQAINTVHRFKTHCKPSSLRDGLLIDKAIHKYGSKHFYVEILESQIENYNEREQYWIQFYNSLKPNGYNILPGGENPPRYVGEQHPTAQLSDEEVLKIKYDLENTKLSLKQIAYKYHTSKRHILGINDGSRRFHQDWCYPLRREPNSSYKLSHEQVQQIIHLLGNTLLLNGEIARQFNVEVHLISDINQGLAYRQKNIIYPIRSWKSSGKVMFSLEEVKQIIHMLRDTSISMNKLAKQYNVNLNVIIGINDGSAKKYRLKNEKYPIRPFHKQGRFKKQLCNDYSREEK